MANTVVHIGADKTGTTAIQRAMVAHRAELLANRIWYPDLDDRPDHRLLATEPGRPLPAPDGVDGFDGLDTVLVSSEALWTLASSDIGELLANLPSGPLTVVAYLRDPVDHAEAAFAQRLRLSRSERELRALFASRRIPAPLNPIVGRAGRRLTQLERWVEAIDRHRASRPDPRAMVRILVRPYDPAGDVVVDLCRTAGLDALIPVLADRPDPRPNPAVDLVTLHASVLVRAEGGPAAQARFLDAVAARSANDGPSSTTGVGPLLSEPLRRRIRRRTEPILDRIADAVGGVERPRERERRPVSIEPGGLNGEQARARLRHIWPAFPAGGPVGPN